MGKQDFHNAVSILQGREGIVIAIFYGQEFAVFGKRRRHDTITKGGHEGKLFVIYYQLAAAEAERHHSRDPSQGQHHTCLNHRRLGVLF